MANKLGSENRFPILRMLGFASPPSTPPTDELHLFVDEATKSLWWIDDTGATQDIAALAGGYAPGGTDVAVADGGTGASNAATARSNLGISAANTPITDAGTYFAGTDVEAALQELAAAGGGGGGDLTRIAETVLGADAADITFTGISNGYRDLIIVAQCRGTNAGNDWSQLRMRMGDGSIDTGNNYGSFWQQWGTGASTGGGTSGMSYGEVSNMPTATSTAGAFSATVIELLGYANTSRFKGWVGRGSGFGATDNYSWATQGVYRVSAAEVDQLRFYCPTGDLKTGSRITLYGRA